jgi:hypothetical protein
MWGQTLASSNATTGSASSRDQVVRKGELSRKAPSNQVSQNQRVLLTRAIVMTASFFLFWTPYMLKMISEMVMKRPASALFDGIAATGALGSSCMNSILLISFDGRIRKRILRFFRFG